MPRGAALLLGWAGLATHDPRVAGWPARPLALTTGGSAEETERLESHASEAPDPRHTYGHYADEDVEEVEEAPVVHEEEAGVVGREGSSGERGAPPTAPPRQASATPRRQIHWPPPTG